jgi:DNA-directed RNA polymerase specialized sigma24 family protein
MGAVDFEAFVAEVRPRLARASVAAYGRERGAEALSEALAVAWERFDEIVVMANPAGYLFRAGQSRSRPRKRVEPARFPPPAELGLPDVEPGLPAALGCLTERQRACVVLVHGFALTQREVAELLGLSSSAVQNHVERGMQRLRQEMGVQPHANR